MPIPLSTARSWAEKIVAELTPWCERGPDGPMIEIAGSIRRGRPFVGDIDIVAIPSNPVAFRQRVFQAQRTQPIQDGPMNLIVRLGNQVQLDIFLASPETRDLLETKPTNFGSLLLCRTGSVSHNIYLVEHAKTLGLTWNPYYGVFDQRGKCLASQTEAQIFAALQLDYIPPEARER